MNFYIRWNETRKKIRETKITIIHVIIKLEIIKIIKKNDKTQTINNGFIYSKVQNLTTVSIKLKVKVLLKSLFLSPRD